MTATISAGPKHKLLAIFRLNTPPLFDWQVGLCCSGNRLLLGHWPVTWNSIQMTQIQEGYGAFWAGNWLSMWWQPNLQNFLIAWKKLYVILIACSTWELSWQHKWILFHCNNAEVPIWHRGLCICKEGRHGNGMDFVLTKAYHSHSSWLLLHELG